MFTSYTSIKESTDYAGYPFCWKDSTDKIQADFIPYNDLELMINGVPGGGPFVVFFDDLGQAKIPTQNAVMQLLLAREIGGHKIHPECRMIAATNDLTMSAGAVGLHSAIVSRMDSVLFVRVSSDDFFAYATGQPDFNVDVLEYLTRFPNYIHPITMDSGKEETWKFSMKEIKPFPCPRTWHKLSRQINAGIINPRCKNAAAKSRELAFVAGVVGQELANPFLDFAMSNNSANIVKKILADPLNAPLGDGKFEQVQINVSLANRMDESDAHLKAFATYCLRQKAIYGAHLYYMALNRFKQRLTSRMRTICPKEWEKLSDLHAANTGLREVVDTTETTRNPIFNV